MENYLWCLVARTEKSENKSKLFFCLSAALSMQNQKNLLIIKEVFNLLHVPRLTKSPPPPGGEKLKIFGGCWVVILKLLEINPPPHAVHHFENFQSNISWKLVCRSAISAGSFSIAAIYREKGPQQSSSLTYATLSVR